jgi:ferric-dicitrate binding protein FerR (iron transport regulator)
MLNRIFACLACTILLGSSSLARAAETLAVVTTLQGQVVVVDAESKASRTLTVAPDTGRIANNHIWQGDEIRTAAGASATLLFPDGSTVKLAESTGLVVTETPIPGTPAPGRKTLKRQLILGQGSIACDARPNTPYYTSIRTPVGVVGIRGTKLTVSASNGRFQVTVESGQVFVMDTPGRAVFDLGGGQRVQLEVNEQGQLIAQALADGGSPLTASIGNARVRLASGAMIRIGGVAGERLTVTGVAGDVQVTYPATGTSESLPAGKTLPVQGEGAPPALAPLGEETTKRGSPSEGVPSIPTYPVIQGTVEGSPYK